MKQKGQTIVEFAVVLPIFLMLVFGGIYFGIVFMDYLEYNNVARHIAREISLQNETERTATKAKLENSPSAETLAEYGLPSSARFYDTTYKIDTPDGRVQVTIEFKWKEDAYTTSLMQSVLQSLIDSPPPIQYVMRLEPTGT